MKYTLKNTKLFSWGELYYFDFEIYLFIDALKNLNKNQENILNESKKDFEKLITQKISSKEDYDFGYMEVLEFSIEELRKNHRFSIIVSVFSGLESKLKKICEKIEKENNFDIKITHLNSKEYLHCYWIYLTKVYKLNEKKLERYFTPIKQQKIIRNKIVHQEGIIEDNDAKKIIELNLKGVIVNKIQKNEHIIKIEDDSEYIFNLFNAIELFFKELINEIDKRYKEIKK